MMRHVALMIGMLMGLAACSGDQGLNNFRAGQTGPDEFSILPTGPLSMPPDLAVLPAPTPGGANITDPDPQGAALAALGGDPARRIDRGIGGTDQALVAHAARQGRDPQIRTTLATEDARWRARNGRRLLETLTGRSVYQRAYQRQAMDSPAEQLRWQRAGAITQTSPEPAAE